MQVVPVICLARHAFVLSCLLAIVAVLSNAQRVA